MIAERIRLVGTPQWLMLYGAILLAWFALALMAAPEDLRAAGRLYGADLIEALCTVSVSTAGYLSAFLMWTLMLLAMMLPTALPALAAYDDLRHAGHEGDVATLAAGYVAVWLGFAALAAGLQLALLEAQVLSPFGESRSPLLTASLLALAGLYQFTPVKASCLSRCRSPLLFFMEHVEEGPWRNGLRLGLVCIGCCWALMLLAFVGGMASLLFMGLGTLVMTFEKLPQIGRWLSAPLGLTLITAAGFVALGTF